MKRPLLAVGLCIAISGPALCQTQSAEGPPFSLSLSALTTSVEAGQRIELKIVEKNLTDHNLAYQYDFRNNQDRSNNYDVWDASGTKPEPTKKKYPQIGDTFNPVPPHIVKPGKTETSGITITLLHDMTQPGTYTIQGSRRISDEPNDGVVHSNKITVTAVGPLVPPGIAAAQKQLFKPPFTLVLSADKTTVGLGTEVWVRVKWTNTSGQELDASASILDATNVDPNFLFELLDENQRPVPKRAYKFPDTFGHAEFGTLKPGESMTHDINLVRLFEIKQPGKYTVQVSRAIPEALGDGAVKSNILIITVVQPST